MRGEEMDGRKDRGQDVWTDGRGMERKMEEEMEKWMRKRWREARKEI